MSDSKLKKVVKKYEQRFKLNKSDFIKFVTTKVELSQKKCQQFLKLISDDITDQFDQEQLFKLLHYIAAFQADCNILNLDEEQLTKYVKIRFKQSQSKVPDPVQKNQKSLIVQDEPKNRNQLKSNKIDNERTNGDKLRQEISNNSKNKAKQQQRRTQIKLDLQQIDEDYQVGGYSSAASKNNQKEEYERQMRLEEERKEKERERERQQRQERQELLERERALKEKAQRERAYQIEREKEIQRQKEEQEQIQLERIRDQKRKVDQQKSQLKKKSSNSSKSQKQKQPRKLKTIQQQRTDQINLSSSSNVVSGEARKGSANRLEVIQDENTKQLVNIPKFEKAGQDYINPVIKYQIIYKEQYVTWRRYSEIQKLLSILRCKYEGIVLPQMPPKEGIKSNFSYFWRNQVNQQFLDERKQKLKQLLNRILGCQYVCQDQILTRFLEDPLYELPNIGESQSYMQTIFGLKDIIFNYNELKDYGMAYYNYISQSKNKTLSTECSKQYEKLQNIMASIFAINQYRTAMNSNFQRRRQIMYDSKLKPKGPCKTELDKVLEEAQVECHQLNMEYRRYVQLKSTEGWQNQLIKQKSSQGGEALEKIKESHSKTMERISKIEKNLLVSISKFSEKSQKLLANLGKQVMEWRRKAHP